MATSYGSMAGVYQDMGEYSNNHPSYGYFHLGVSTWKNEWEKALSLYEKAVEIEQIHVIILPHGSMAGVYRHMEEIEGTFFVRKSS